MAKRVLNRRQLRDEADQAARATPAPPDAPAAPEAPPATAKRGAAKSAARAPKKPAAPKKSRVKKEPPRLRARWGVFDNGMKQVAIFDYNQRPAADQKLADLNAKKPGQYFLQIVKEPMPAPAPLPA